MKTLTAMVVEDSAVARELLVATLNADPRITVVAAVETGEDAVRLAPRLAPDVISMDVRLPGMSGIEATRRIMEEFPTPVIVVASDVGRATTASAMEAMRAGALLVVEKPTIASPDAYGAFAKRFCDQVVSLSGIKVVRQRFNPPFDVPPARDRAITRSTVSDIDVVGIVASTGGPPALAHLLASFGDDATVPVLVVQHMGAVFLEGFAAWLGDTTGRDVRLASDGEPAVPGRIYVAPGGHHLEWRAGRLRLASADGAGHVPSGDALLASLAAAAGPRAVGVVLTGMGEDGARGLLALRRAGGLTIAQDRATSAVYGMPAAAKALGAVDEELPLAAIGPRIRDLLAASVAQRAKTRSAR